MKRKQWTAVGSEPTGPDPVKLLENLMKQRKLRAVDPAARFEVDQELFNRPYTLTTPQQKIDKPAGRTGQPQKGPPPKKGPRDTAILELLQRRTGMATIAKMKNGSSIMIWNIMYSYDFIGAGYAHIMTNVTPSIKGEKTDVCSTSDIVKLIDPVTGNSIYPPAPQ